MSDLHKITFYLKNMTQQSLYIKQNKTHFLPGATRAIEI